jgi:catechol 2,3-dioxygenase-like lactoylglutathione lyase family enzyme
MRLDHVAYRTADRKKTAQFFIDAFDYHVQQEFEIDFGEGDKALCIALEPPEKVCDNLEWIIGDQTTKYHMAPEIFVSDGTPNSIVGLWVAARGGIGGIHHLAYQVPNVEAKMKEWAEKGWGEFTSEKPFHCEGLTQVFSKPHAFTGVVYEFIERTGFGFCKENVANLMRSTVAKIDAQA